ncbi:MAG TPA: glutamate-cysteine ligase family protein [Saprospiraceae bacterium]|nr:glutamate-cysteine ligase family protein [Saprospiraceae bacterium]HQW57164.1 glutamate-cysteine ligase family protein [Saprospiraceae bacterium]
MGEQSVNKLNSKEELQKFVKYLLNDVKALEMMLEQNLFETDPIRIGAEQEMVMVNKKTYKPSLIAMEVLEEMKEYEWLGTELAKFNLESNLMPREFTGKCFSDMEQEVLGQLEILKPVLDTFDSKIVLTGILPTLNKFDLTLDNLTPKDRYYALMEAFNELLLGSAYELRLAGIDELSIKHDSPLLEACNTSFQVHLQVKPDDFVKQYNIAQTLAAPVIALAANSPIVFGRRLWHESRIALFQQALDTRTSSEHMRDRSPRVSFGKGWLKNSILDIYKEDISRFRVIMTGDNYDDSIKMVNEGKIPSLKALQIHNSTVYRWNRPCYGISPNGQPHLRIENRVFASGPTVIDEVANAAFWLGMMAGMHDQYNDITKSISWDDVRDNFGKAAQFGIDSKFTWLKDQKIGPAELALGELIPLAEHGLKLRGIDSHDISRYMDVIKGRAEKHMTGARWQLRAYTSFIRKVSRDEATTVLTQAILKNQEQEIPVHKWKAPKLSDLEEYKPTKLFVEEFMETDLFTVQKDDIIELVAEMMNWRKIRYMPVEDNKGNLVGLVTSRLLLRHFADRVKVNCEGYFLVKDIMINRPETIHPRATIMEALNIMRTKRIGCLPVVDDHQLIGIITEMDFLRITSRLLERIEYNEDDDEDHYYHI